MYHPYGRFNCQQIAFEIFQIVLNFPCVLRPLLIQWTQQTIANEFGTSLAWSTKKTHGVLNRASLSYWILKYSL